MDHVEPVSTFSSSHFPNDLAFIIGTSVKFVFQGYLRGVQNFIDKYYEMIHRAAGWNSLRMFLLVGIWIDGIRLNILHCTIDA